jgi:DNA topoisomerase-3
VFESETDFLCERSQEDKKPCKFKSGKVILNQPMGREEMARLLTTGRTELLEGFISRRGRPFKAWLVLQEGKVTFEFPDKDAGG